VSKAHSKSDWTPCDAEDLYMMNAWADGFFSVNDEGNVHVNVGSGTGIDVNTVVHTLEQKGASFPLLIRFQDILQGRVERINEAFSNAISESGYSGKYVGVYPIKVNQLHEVVEELLDAGKPFGMGLECGSKAELIAALPLIEDEHTLLICNGYKDRAMLDLILTGQQLKRKVLPVMEKLDEFRTWEELASRRSLDAPFGIRLRLTTAGAGKWADSGGDLSKFGVSIPELVGLVDGLIAKKQFTRFKLLHFHLGSQISDIRILKKAVREITQVYVQLVQRGLQIEYLDVGGGLGINYGGSYANTDDAINYSLQEYANAIISTIKEVCRVGGVVPPTLVSESGRALTAHHSVLIMNTVGVYTKDKIEDDFSPIESDHQVVKDLFESYSWLCEEPDMQPVELLEAYHDASSKRLEADSLFSLGYMPLEQKALVEKLYWGACRRVNKRVHELESEDLPPELEALDNHLIDQCLCDFSVFQSLLDHWAINQRFPIMPLQRLNVRPDRRSVLVDLTCDSDGKVSSYIGSGSFGKNFLEMHEIEKGETYRFCIFLMGAYQDIMGDTHNLFGRVSEAHVYADEKETDGFYVEKIIPGTTIQDMLSLVQYFPNDLYNRMSRHVRSNIQSGNIPASTGYDLLERYQKLFQLSTYYDRNGHE
jgi:arginine decarboxylase